MTARRMFRVLGLATALCGLVALGWAAQAYVDLVRLESAVVDSCARVETASRIRVELVENLLEGVGAVIGDARAARLGRACERVREARLSPDTLGDAENYRDFHRAQIDLSEALGTVWDAPSQGGVPFAVADLRPELDRWSAALDRSLAEMKQQLDTYRVSIGGFPGALIAAAVRREGSPAIATQALAGSGDAVAPAARTVR